jgi:cytochrome c5
MASASVGLPPADVTPADLPDPTSSGAKLVGQYCTACHGVTTPTTHSATDWPIVMRRMWMRMDNLAPEFNVPRPTSAERLAMLNYLRDNALKVSAAGLPDAPGRDTFVTTCGQCHDLPDPMQHSAEDWVAVVQRMSGRMETMLDKQLGQQDFTRIVLYLESLTKQSE